MSDTMVSDAVLSELQELTTGYISDGMAHIGLHGGWLAGLAPRAYAKTSGCVVGRVLTVQWAPRQGRGRKRLTLYEVIRERREETILLIAGGKPDCYLLGENTAAAAKVEGFDAIMVDGCIRDSASLWNVGIEIFTSGIEGGHPDSIEVLGYNLPLLFRGEWIEPGDIVAADGDGAVVFPADRAAEVLHHAQVIARLEVEQANVIRQRGPLADLVAVLQQKTTQAADGQ